MRYRLIGTAALFAMLAGCEIPAPQGAWETKGEQQDFGPPEYVNKTGMLALLNSPSTSVDVLDHEVQLDVRAAEALIAHRNGWDGVLGTADDNPFESTEEVDSVPYVGPVAMGRLEAFASAWGWSPPKDAYFGTWKSVPFSVEEAENTLEFVNLCTLEDLDITAGLDIRAAEEIIWAQPVSSLTALANVPYVGPKTLEKLRDIASAVFSATHDAPAGPGNSMASEESKDPVLE